MKKMIALIALTAFTAACAGRSAHPIPTTSPLDSQMSCSSIIAERQGLENQIPRLRDEGKTTGYNVAIFLSGWLLLFLTWAAFDIRTKSATKKEIKAIRARQDHLATIYATDCAKADRDRSRRRGTPDTQRELDTERDERRHGELLDAIREN